MGAQRAQPKGLWRILNGHERAGCIKIFRFDESTAPHIKNGNAFDAGDSELSLASVAKA